MPFPDVAQPNIININDVLRLRAYDGIHSIAYRWYQDDIVRKFSEGITDPTIRLDASYVEKKLNALNKSGELY